MPTHLHDQVDKLRAWLATHRRVDDYDCWWGEVGVVGALQGFLARGSPQDWSERDVTDLLYVLEQSSTDYVVELFGQNEPALLAIARHSAARGGIASDDIAERLGDCRVHRDEAEALLIACARNDHERTRRMALLSLARLQSDAVPALAVAAWDTGDEYQRIGALAALELAGSPLLPAYLERAREDGRANLAAAAGKYADASPTKQAG